MFKDNVNGISIASVMDAHNKSKDGLFPIKIRVILNRSSTYYMTGKRLSKEDWKRIESSRSPELAKIKKNIKDSFDLIVKYVNELSASGNFSFQTLSVRFGRGGGKTIDSYYKNKIESLLEEKRVGTAKNDAASLKAFQKYAGQNIPLERVTVEWLKRMEIKMLDDNTSMTTIGIRMRSLRAVMSIARKEGAISVTQYPFGDGKYQIQNTEGTKKALTLQQIHKFVTYDTGNNVDTFYRDIWFFIYLCNWKKQLK